MANLVVIRGGGDLASGTGLRLHRAGLRVVVSELAQPLVVRRGVAFAQAVFTGQTSVEEAQCRRAADSSEAMALLEQGIIPVLVDPQAHIAMQLQPTVVVDGRMTKQPPGAGLPAARLVIGLGPGFSAGVDCHAVIETQRGHRLGQVIWQGTALADTGIPETLGDRGAERVLRAPADGVFKAHAAIGEHLEPGQEIGEVAGQFVLAPFRGVLRGILYPGVAVRREMKIADLDPRDEPSFCWLVSDKALAVAGGVLEAVLAQSEVRIELWGLK